MVNIKLKLFQLLLRMQSSDKDDFICCTNCCKKLFKVKYGAGVILIICRGCRKEVPVRFGKLADLGQFVDTEGS